MKNRELGVNSSSWRARGVSATKGLVAKTTKSSLAGDREVEVDTEFSSEETESRHEIRGRRVVQTHYIAVPARIASWTARERPCYHPIANQEERRQSTHLSTVA